MQRRRSIFATESLLRVSRNKILVIMNISVLEFYGYIGNIGRYFDKNMGKEKIKKNTLKFMEILC